tara:strand:+ start:228 stop:626 length:399 start_codon:yes stop_codon:yes gene_type:complete
MPICVVSTHAVYARSLEKKGHARPRLSLCVKPHEAKSNNIVAVVMGRSTDGTGNGMRTVTVTQSYIIGMERPTVCTECGMRMGPGSSKAAISMETNTGYGPGGIIPEIWCPVGSIEMVGSTANGSFETPRGS